MIVTRAPLRMSFAGGGTDLPAYYLENHDGAVVSATINMYVHTVVNRRFEGDIRISYSKTEIVDKVEDIKHDIIRHALRRAGIRDGIEIVSVADVSGRGTGLGSSSSFAVSLVEALDQFRLLKGGKPIEDKKVEWIAQQACNIEMIDCEKTMGKQDQYAAAYGGLNYFEFKHDGVSGRPLNMSAELVRKMRSNLLLFWTGISRSADDVLVTQAAETFFGDARPVLNQMAKLAPVLRDELEKGNIDALGEILHENWLLKRSLTEKISSPEIDEWYKTARANGAIGGKLLGAGGGGFLLFFVPSSRRYDVIKSLPLRGVPFEFTPKGVEVIYMDGLNG